MLRRGRVGQLQTFEGSRNSHFHMEDSSLRADGIRFFDAFVSAFESFDGHELARRYAAPYASVQADGSLKSFATQAAISAYFQRVLDDYWNSGCRSCRFSDLEVKPLGERCLLATVTWELLDEHKNVLSYWRESYGLRRLANSLDIFASVDHAEK